MINDINFTVLYGNINPTIKFTNKHIKLFQLHLAAMNDGRRQILVILYIIHVNKMELSDTI